MFYRSKKRLLHIPHWQLFALTSGFAILLLFIADRENQTSGANIGSFNYLTAALVLPTTVYYLWLWTLGSKLWNNLGVTGRFSMGNFRTHLILAMGLTFLHILLSSTGADFIGGNVYLNLLVVGIMVIVYAWAWLNVQYTLAELFARLETSTITCPWKHHSYLLLLVFFPLGIWFLQPTVNKLLKKRNSSRSNLSGQVRQV